MILAGIDWHNMFVPSESLPELFLRGTIMYLFVLALMRVFRREAGSLSIPDLLVVVLVADAAQNGMSAEYHSITEAFVLVATIFLWNYALDWLSYRSPTIYRLLHPTPLLLIKDGRVLRRNLASEMLTLGDLMSQLREQGVEDVRQVKRSFVEPDGRLSVVKYAPSDQAPGKHDRHSGVS